MPRERLTWNNRKKASPPPQIPAVDRTEKGDHPAYYSDPEYGDFAKGDPDAWAETPKPPPYLETAPPNMPGNLTTEEPDHPAYPNLEVMPPSTPVTAKQARLYRQAALCQYIATKLLEQSGRRVPMAQLQTIERKASKRQVLSSEEKVTFGLIKAVERKAASLMDLSHSDLLKTAKTLNLAAPKDSALAVSAKRDWALFNKMAAEMEEEEKEEEGDGKQAFFDEILAESEEEEEEDETASKKASRAKRARAKRAEEEEKEEEEEEDETASKKASQLKKIKAALALLGEEDEDEDEKTSSRRAEEDEDEDEKTSSRRAEEDEDEDEDEDDKQASLILAKYLQAEEEEEKEDEFPFAKKEKKASRKSNSKIALLQRMLKAAEEEEKNENPFAKKDEEKDEKKKEARSKAARESEMLGALERKVAKMEAQFGLKTRNKRADAFEEAMDPFADLVDDDAFAEDMDGDGIDQNAPDYMAEDRMLLAALEKLERKAQKTTGKTAAEIELQALLTELDRMAEEEDEEDEEAGKTATPEAQINVAPRNSQADSGAGGNINPDKAPVTPQVSGPMTGGTAVTATDEVACPEDMDMDMGMMDDPMAIMDLGLEEGNALDSAMLPDVDPQDLVDFEMMAEFQPAPQAKQASSKLGLKPQPKKASAGAQRLGQVAAPQSSEVDDLSQLWGSVPDVRQVFGIPKTY